MIYPARYFYFFGGPMKKKTNVRILTECSIMTALCTVLSIVKLFEMPYGGSITLASMMPVAIISYRHGTRYGVLTASAVSIIQMLLGVKNFSYFTSWQSLVALAVLDYALAFAVFGLVGLMRPLIKRQSISLGVGVAAASIIRYACHVISGATVWAGLSIPSEAALVYSLSYNATYMIPETVILVLCTVYVGASLDLTAPIPTRIKSMGGAKLPILYVAAALSALAALVTDTVLVFSKLQSDSGEINLTALSEVNWIAVAIVSAVCAALALALILIERTNKKTKPE